MLIVGDGNQVAGAWQKAYPSLKPLDAWMRELVARTQQLAHWANSGPPSVFWLGGFTYPTGFLTAVLQVRAAFLKLGDSKLSWLIVLHWSDIHCISTLEACCGFPRIKYWNMP